MDTGTIVWLGVLVVLGVLFLLTLRRLSVLMGRTRDLERFQGTVRHLDKRLSVAADPFVTALDEIRRRAGNPEGLHGAIPNMYDAMRAIAAEGRAARVPRGLEREAAAFQVELERAVRAVELVGHGLDAFLADRGGRSLEAETALKRGALNLRHAREAASNVAADIGRIRPGDLIERTRAGAPGPAAAGIPTYVVDSDFDEGR